MPPAALMSIAAWSTPFFICDPVAALAPVIGPPTPNFTCADADPVNATAKPSARPSTVSLFMEFPSGLGPAIKRNATSLGLAAPAEPAIRLIDPAILPDHLRRPRCLKADKTESQADHAVDDVIMRRQQRPVEQSEMDKADG